MTNTAIYYITSYRHPLKDRQTFSTMWNFMHVGVVEEQPVLTSQWPVDNKYWISKMTLLKTAIAISVTVRNKHIWVFCWQSCLPLDWSILVWLPTLNLVRLHLCLISISGKCGDLWSSCVGVGGSALSEWLDDEDGKEPKRYQGTTTNFSIPRSVERLWKSRAYQFYKPWSGPTGVRTHNLAIKELYALPPHYLIDILGVMVIRIVNGKYQL